MRVMITGGGTGGHTSPAIAIIEELIARDPRLEIQWVGRRGGLEERVCARMSIPFRSVRVIGWPRGNRIKQAWAALTLALGVARAYMHILKFRPQVILGVGGYVSVPLTWAAQRLSIPTILHEQNKRLGMANRILAKKAQRLLLSYSDTKGTYAPERGRVVGNPVRAAFSAPPSREDACAAQGLDSAVPVVLVYGGSQGAASINDAMFDALELFRDGELQFIWMTGQSGVSRCRARADQVPVSVTVHAYIDDMAAACASADLVVCRAGASGTAELAVMGKPSILIPYPHATENHQEENARAFEAAGAALLLTDDACTGPRLAEEIRALVTDPVRLEDMAQAASTLVRPAATESIVEEIFSLVFDSAQ